MRVVLQRVSQARVEVDDKTIGSINTGILAYLSVTHDDTEKNAQFIADKLVNLRIFSDQEGKMNLSVLDVGGEILLISNFTLHGDCRKGRRPGFDAAAKPEIAEKLYDRTAELIREKGIQVEKGIFGAHMHVTSTNNGPVTFIIDC
jgi:D-tyrosyl-tRNA(Tyr) deacylase